MFFQNSEQPLIPCGKFKNAAGQDIIFTGAVKNPQLKIRLILVHFNQNFGKCPFSAVLHSSPQAFDLLGRSNAAAIDDFGQEFVHILYQKIKTVENKAVFNLLFGFQKNPGDQVGIILIFFHLLKQQV